MALLTILAGVGTALGLAEIGKLDTSKEDVSVYENTSSSQSNAKKVVATATKSNGKKTVTTGYISNSDLEQLTPQTVPIPRSFVGLEAIDTPTRLQEQFFEVYEVVEGDSDVTIHARHIWYRNLQNHTTWVPEANHEYSGAEVCRAVMNNTIFPTGYVVASDSLNTLPSSRLDFSNKNLVETFLDPERGICALYGLSLIRNNDAFYCLKNVGYDRGFVIEDGKNLLGVERTESIENTFTRIAPIAKDADGSIVWLNYNGKKYIDSPYIGNYSNPRLEIYDTEMQIGKDGVTADNVQAKLLQAAQNRFSVDMIDTPEIQMTIEFLSLGDTEEYAQYKGLDKVYLYDILSIKDKVRGYQYQAQVIGVEHDILTGMLNSVTIGNLRHWNGTRKIGQWQIPEINGALIRQNTIQAGSFSAGAVGSKDIADNAVNGSKISQGSVTANHLHQYLKEDIDGLMITVPEVQSTVNGITGSALWVQRNNITGVVGEFEVVTDPATGKKTLKVISGGGMLIRRNNVEFGLYDQGNLTGGVMVEKINDVGTVTKIRGDRVDVEASQVRIGTTSNVQQWMTDTGQDINTLEGIVADKATIADLNALKARVGTIEADYLDADTVASGTLGVGTLDAGEVITGPLTAEGIDCTNLDANSVDCTFINNVDVSGIGSFVKDASVSGNTLTLTKANGDTVTFSKAASSASWSWAGGAPRVTLSPQDQTFYGPAINGITFTGSKTWATDKKSFTQDFYCYDEKSNNVYRENLSIDTKDSYNAGHSAGYLAGWNAACGAIRKSGNIIIGPVYGSPGSTERKYMVTLNQAEYTASSYTKESHSYSASSLSTWTGSITYGIAASSYYKASSHSYTASKYTASSFTPASITWS